jgi:hypothetical protein
MLVWLSILFYKLIVMIIELLASISSMCPMESSGMVSIIDTTNINSVCPSPVMLLLLGVLYHFSYLKYRYNKN